MCVGSVPVAGGMMLVWGGRDDAGACGRRDDACVCVGGGGG